jgi:RimJ/RimL family protein N-acetyltransferase
MAQIELCFIILVVINAMKFFIQPITLQDASTITAWRYEPPYAVYNLSQEEIPVLRDPDNHYYIVQDETGRTVGYCCFGKEGRVPGGSYGDAGSIVLDVGVGMDPELVGRGFGGDFVEAILLFAAEEYKPSRFRVSIADFNKRSQQTFINLGFIETFRFTREGDGKLFIQLERIVNK